MLCPAPLANVCVSVAAATLCCALYSGCSSDPVADAGGRADASALDGAASADGSAVRDATSVDAMSVDAPAASADAARRDAAGCAAPPAPPTTRLAPAAGELFYLQLGLGGFSLGESALLVGPDGTRVLIDVGNDSHSDDVQDALVDYAGGAAVDDIVVTHFHADHGDGLADLLSRITWTGTLVHRGFTDFSAAANDRTIQRVCDAARGRPGADAALCTSTTPAPCDPSAWVGTYPATSCAGLGTHDLDLGGGARLDFVAANATIGDARFETLVGPLHTTDSNGENARSVVAVLAHGAFRMLLAGDLTGGGSDTDDVESFLASRLDGVGIDARGVDVLHAGHHGRDTSTNRAWADRLLPIDGRDRNTLMGISTAHLRSPHRVVLDVLLSEGRLGAGAVWTTRVATGGATAAGLLDADGGHVLLATLEGGDAYAVQIVSPAGAVLETRTFRSVRACGP